MTSLAGLRATAAMVRRTVAPTPLHRWPLLERRSGAQVWVKHENHTAIGAFKLRGGLAYMAALKERAPDVTGVVAATRGNHGQSVAFAAARAGLAATVVVPHGNSVEKNAAMAALGAALVEHGRDFQEALEHARGLAAGRGLHMLPSFHDDLVRGVAGYALELFDEGGDFDTVYVPIGLGSGICAALRIRDALGRAAKIVGVVAAAAPAYALSLARGEAVATASADTVADGLAVRTPHPQALAEIAAGAERIVTVEEDEIAAAMGHYLTDTHNLAEGAGAAPLAALLKEGEAMRGRKVALILTGGNVDRALLTRLLG